MDDRSVPIVIGGEEYNLLLTVKATKEISKRYGGFEKLNSEVFASGDMGNALEELEWLIVTLTNHGESKHISAEYIDEHVCPADLVNCREHMIDAITRGLKREIISEDDGKNTVGE